MIIFSLLLFNYKSQFPVPVCWDLLMIIIGNNVLPIPDFFCTLPESSSPNIITYDIGCMLNEDVISEADFSDNVCWHIRSQSVLRLYQLLEALIWEGIFCADVHSPYMKISLSECKWKYIGHYIVSENRFYAIIAVFTIKQGLT